MTLHSDLEKAFNPEAVAIVGVSSREKPFHPGYTGLRFLRLLRSSGFRGRVYPINPKPDEVGGAKAYPSLLSVPEPPDLVIITVPAASVPGMAPGDFERGIWPENAGLNWPFCSSVLLLQLLRP